MNTKTSIVRSVQRSTVRARLSAVLVLGGAFTVGALGLAGRAEAATYCQQHGHGATGCNLGGNDNTGVCAASSWSPTGYVCREPKATTQQEPQQLSFDPVEPAEHDEHDELDELEEEYEWVDM